LATQRGETEGGKTRSTCVVVAARGANDGLIHLALLAVTTQPRTPMDRAGSFRYRIRRAGLSDLKRCWIIVDEYNDDVAEQSWYREPDGPALGRFSKEDRRSVRREVAQIGSPRQSDRPSGRPAPIAPA
jgi:hypothetical protein